MSAYKQQYSHIYMLVRKGGSTQRTVWDAAIFPTKHNAAVVVFGSVYCVYSVCVHGCGMCTRECDHFGSRGAWLGTRAHGGRIGETYQPMDTCTRWYLYIYTYACLYFCIDLRALNDQIRVYCSVWIYLLYDLPTISMIFNQSKGHGDEYENTIASIRIKIAYSTP